jgi:hypothetical protein
LSHIQSDNRLTILGSNAGTAYLLRSKIPGKFRPPLTLGWKYNVQAAVPLSAFPRDVAFGEILILVPYWLSIALAGAVTCGPWLPWSRRFSLRMLLLATALAAVGLGAFAAAK